MDAKLKKVILWLVLAFCVYAVVTSPERSADVVKEIWHIITTGFTRIGDFFNALTS